MFGMAFLNFKRMVKSSPLTVFVLIGIELLGAIMVIMTYGIVRNIFTEETKVYPYLTRSFVISIPSGLSMDALYEKNDRLLSSLDRGCRSISVSGNTEINSESHSIGGLEYGSSQYLSDDANHYNFEFQSLAKGERIAAVSSEAFPLLDVGDTLEIDGMGFIVVYTDKDIPDINKTLACDVLVPYKALPKSCNINRYALELDDMPTKAEISKISASIKELFGTGVELTEPTLPELLVQQFNAMSKLLCVIVLFTVANSSAMAYMFVIYKRRKWLTAVKMCGAENNQCIEIFFIEILCIASACFMLGAVFSKYVLIPRYTEVYPAFALVFDRQSFIYLFISFILASLIILAVDIQEYINRSVADMQRRSK